MATTAANIRVGVTGGVYFDDSSSPVLPTDATGAIDSGFGEVGYLTDAGVTQNVDESTNDIRAWQNGDLVRRVKTETNISYEFTMLETNEETLSIFYGNYSAGHVELTSDQGVRGAWVIEVLDGDYTHRIVIPDGQVTTRGAVSFVNGEAITYPVTVTAYPDSTGVAADIFFDPASLSA